MNATNPAAVALPGTGGNAELRRGGGAGRPVPTRLQPVHPAAGGSAGDSPFRPHVALGLADARRRSLPAARPTPRHDVGRNLRGDGGSRRRPARPGGARGPALARRAHPAGGGRALFPLAIRRCRSGLPTSCTKRSSTSSNPAGSTTASRSSLKIRTNSPSHRWCGTDSLRSCATTILSRGAI